ncbi:hypothetical protein TgHK011_009326 [Trichoderma gracile]|nr:hypothetical protein TgHK011_009326 [Trichoderma gracile]
MSTSITTMPPTDKQQQECWECLRRCLACDGRRPVCECCRSAGIDGFGCSTDGCFPQDASLSGTTAVAAVNYREGVNEDKARNITDTHDHEDEDDDPEEGDEGEEEGPISSDSRPSTEVAATTRPQTLATSLALVPHKRQNSISTKRQSVSCIPISLQQDEFELMEAVEYYNHHIYPIISSNQVIPNAYARRFDKTRVAELNPSNRHALISISIGFRILAVAQIHRLSINPRVVGPASDLWTSFFRHVGLAMAALNDEIRQHPKRYLANIFRSIHLIASSELFLLNSPHWRAHVSGFMAILQEQGGLGTFIKDPGGSRYIVLSFLVSCIVANTTSSLEHQILEVACLNPKELYSLFKVSIYPPFLCPPDLFLDILYINRLRLRLPTTSVIYSLPGHEDKTPTASSQPISTCNTLPMPQRATFADSAPTYQATLRSLFTGDPQDTETDLSKIFSPTFQFTTGSEKYDFAGFVEHIRRLREMKLSVNLTTVEFLRDGNLLAERHVSVTLQSGKKMSSETFMFAEIAEDGRINWIKEAVQSIEGWVRFGSIS